jgi:tetratricopeptide (TPR) repeat protein
VDDPAVVNIRFVLCLLATGTVPAQEAPPRAEPVDPALRSDQGQDWYQHGRNLYEAAKRSIDNDRKIAGYAQAVDVLSRYLDQHSKHPNAEAAYWYLAESYYGAGRVDDAKRTFHLILNRFPNGRYGAAAAYRLAADHFNNRQYALAAPLFEKMAAIATVPVERQRGLFHAAFSYELQGRTREAIEYHRKVLADPTQPNVFLERSQLSLGRLLSRAEKLDEALPLLDKVVMARVGPELRGPAAIEAGTIAAKQGNLELSDKYLMLVLTTPGMEPYKPDAQLALMKARYDLKKYAEVIDIFRRSAEKAVGEREALRLMLAGRSFMELKKNVEALELFREVEKLMLPNNSFAFEANFLRLLCFFRIEGRHVPEQVDAFLDLYRKNRPRDPKIHTALLMKAETLMDAKRVEEAAKVYLDIDADLLSEENRPGLLFKRAWCLAASEDPQGAIRSFSDFIEGFPNDERVPQALIQRAKAFRDTGEPGKALADYDLLLSRETNPEYQSLALLESADIAKQENNLPDMIARYRNFLEKFPDATESRKAKANYWLAWGLTKTDKVKEALPHAEAARTLDAKTYGKNAGTLMAIGHWTLQAPDPVCEEVDLAIKGSYVEKLPDQLINWAGMQAFSAERFDQAARFFSLIADEQEPRATPKEIWRYLGKSLLAAGKPEAALPPIDRALEFEDNPGWEADGLLDRSKALLGLGRTDDAMKAAEEGQALRPDGRVSSEIRLVQGDIHTMRNDPAQAAAAYVVVVELLDDNDTVLKPLALWKMIKALEAKGDQASSESAAEYRQQLETKYPTWKPPVP